MIKSVFRQSLAFIASLAFTAIMQSCEKETGTFILEEVKKFYSVTVVVQDPNGQPLGGAKVYVKGKSENDPVFSGVTNSSGIAKIKSPAGNRVIVAKIGSVFSCEQAVYVKTDNSTTTQPMVMQQNPSLKVLVVLAFAEQLEDVLSVIGFTQFDSIEVTDLRTMASADSAATLQYLKQYTLVFSDCNGGDEGGYPLLARIYGRYIADGGKIYGGHYNYYNLQTIFPPYFINTESNSGDSLSIIDASLINYIGFTSALWPINITDPRPLNTFQQFRDIPGSSRIYSVITNTTVPLIAENYSGRGKYLYTVYHNQNIKDDPQLIKIVKYFLYSM